MFPLALVQLSHFQLFRCVMSSFVKKLPSCIKDTKHALPIFDQILFRGPREFIFTIDAKSVCTVIPHRHGLEALKFLFDQRTVLF